MNVIDIVDRLPHLEYTERRGGLAALRKVVIHHTAGQDNPVTSVVEPEVVPPEEIARWHLAKGWTGIGYTFLVYWDGKVYKTRPIGAVPACVDGSNTVSVCVAIVGNYMLKAPSAAAWQSAVQLTRHLLTWYPQIRQVVGHGEVPGQGTDCPGRLTDMAQFRREVGV